MVQRHGEKCQWWQYFYQNWRQGWWNGFTWEGIAGCSVAGGSTYQGAIFTIFQYGGQQPEVRIAGVQRVQYRWRTCRWLKWPEVAAPYVPCRVPITNVAKATWAIPNFENVCKKCKMIGDRPSVKAKYQPLLDKLGHVEPSEFECP